MLIPNQDMLEKIYNDFLVEFQNEGVYINEVHSAELKRHNPNSETGFISYNCNGGSFHLTYILIDSSIELELKLNRNQRSSLNLSTIKFCDIELGLKSK